VAQRSSAAVRNQGQQRSTFRSGALELSPQTMDSCCRPWIAVVREAIAHAALMQDRPGEAAHAGRLRTVKNWIGGSDYSPRGALYVPTPDMVPAYMQDLISFANRREPPGRRTGFGRKCPVRYWCRELTLAGTIRRLGLSSAA
jgi:hypothetical protein